MGELLLLAMIGTERVALRAADVQSVIEIGAVAPVPRTDPHIAGLTALRSQALTVVDCAQSIGLPEGEERERQAIVVKHDGHHYALRVDRVDDITEALTEPGELSASLDGGWHRIAVGLVETALGPVLLADVPALIAGPEDMDPEKREAA